MKGTVLIVGAGACGLYAAYLLGQQGIDVTIVEGRDRVGGRINTVKGLFSVPVDLGAEFIHGDQKITRDLLRHSGAKIRVLEGEWKQVKLGRISIMEQSGDHWEQLIERMNALKYDQDLTSFLDENFSAAEYGSLRESVIGFVEGYDAADSHHVSVFTLRDEWQGQGEEDQAQIENGYCELVDYLANKVRLMGGTIKLNYNVVEIRRSEDGVAVVGANGESSRAEKVLVTVPIGVLQGQRITFTPELPFDLKVFHHIGWGGVIKFVYEFRDAFWKGSRNGEFRRTSFITSDASVPTWWTRANSDLPILTGWLGGPSTFKRQLDKELLHRQALESLAYICDRNVAEVEALLLREHITDWISDPFCWGAYSYNTVTSNHARSILTQPIDGCIYFGGEALYDGPGIGTVEAALVSARDTVQRMYP